MKSLRPISALILLLNLVSSSAVAQSPCKLRADFSEDLLRRGVINAVLPEFPEDAVKRKVKGKAVAFVVVNEEGAVNSVDVTELPDAALKQSIIDAVRQWRFKVVFIKGKPICVTGRLTFKFTIEKGKGRVKDAPSNQ